MNSEKQQHWPPPTSWGRYDANLLRVQVERWDASHLYVVEPQTQTRLRVCYDAANRYLTREGKGDWSYLSRILSVGDTLNLVRLRWRDDVCLPELIIYQPDYLINITTISSCFDESLRESPFVGLVNKVKADAPSVAMHLGHLAGKMLDETVRQSDTPFADSFLTFFHDNALTLSCCHGMSEPGSMEALKKDGEKQKHNIQQIMAYNLPHALGHYEHTKVILEPSFISEILGIQGRLDLLYQDGRDTVIVEQKSGKGAFVPFSTPGYNADMPQPVNKHIVQLLLYRALFQYEFQKYADQLKHVFLLYSKYTQGLVPIVGNTDLLLRAFRMRNLLAWSELQYAEGAFRYLDSIKPDTLKSPSVSDRFWAQYKEPEFRRILMPLHLASPLERAYYYRFQRFIATEQKLAKMGHGRQEDAGFSSIWMDTLQQKKAAGNIYDDLTILSCAESGGSVRSVTLAFPEEEGTDMSNFRAGDIVFLYPYTFGSIPNACAQMVQRGSIVDITPQTVTLQLRNRQTDRKVFLQSPDTRWAIEHDLMDASSSSLYRAMHTFLSAGKDRRDLILLQRPLRVNAAAQLKGEYGAMNELVLRAKQAEDLFLVIGPPGTGKTSFGMLNILQEELTDPLTNILLLSYTNRAVDEICSKLVESGIDFMRIGSELSCDPAYRDHLVDRRLRSLNSPAAVRSLLSQTRVICGTTVALNANAVLFNVKAFDLAIVDEASQILEPHILGLLSVQTNGMPAIRRFVLIGDHKQLPAVVQQDAEQSAVTEPELQAIGLTDCRQSLFERMLRRLRTEQGAYAPHAVYMLRKQGRMHRDIAAFPNKAFYQGQLDIVGSPLLPHQDEPLPADSSSASLPAASTSPLAASASSPAAQLNGIPGLLDSRAMAFLHVPSPVHAPSDKVNILEADMMAATAVCIVQREGTRFDENKTLGIIVPYRNQIATVRHALSRHAAQAGLSYEASQRLARIAVDTVERYQGSQRDYILYGFTVQHPLQLEFLTSNTFTEDDHIIDRKLNVAMTRARRRLLLFGNASLLRHASVFSDLLDFLTARNAYFEISPQDYCEGNFQLYPPHNLITPKPHNLKTS